MMESGGTKPVLTEQQRSDQVDLLTKRMDQLADQFKALLDLQSSSSMGAGVGLSSVPSIPTPFTSGVVTSLPGVPVVTTAVTACHGLTSVVHTGVTPVV